MPRAKPQPRQTPRQVVAAYMRGVMSGKVIAGRLVKLAVRRHLDDLKNGHERGIYFDAKIADEACQFFPLVLRHSIGEWDGAPFELSPWQTFIVWTLFGWRRESDGMRRFRKALISIARKNGKSTFAAGIALLILNYDNPIEPGAEIYVVATKEDQAKIVHSEACRMVKKSSSLARRSTVYKNNIAVPSTNSFFRPIGSDSDKTDGLNPVLVILDELHAWQPHHRGLYEKLTTGGAARRQPLTFMITTAGDELNSKIWKEEDEFAVKVLESVVTGDVVSDTHFAFLARIDDQRACDKCSGDGCDGCENGLVAADEPLDERCWGKANPNLGKSVKLEYLRDQANEAAKKPTALSSFIRYHANHKTQGSERAVLPELWKRGDKDLSDWDGLPSYGAFDLGWSNDLASMTIVCRIDDEDTERGLPAGRFETRSWSFVPRECERDLSREPWDGFIRCGSLIVTEGNTTDIPGAFKSKLLEVTETYNVVQWAFDPNQARHLSTELLNEYGIECFKFFQTHGMYNESVRTLMKALKDGTLIHGGDPVLTWCALNMTISKDHRDHWMPSKSDSRDKIDAAVALIMAIGGAMVAPEQVRAWSREDGILL